MQTLSRLDDAPADVQELIDTWPIWPLFRLQPGDTVAVVGAYKGKVMEFLARLTPGLDIHGFEPQAWAAQLARDRFEAKPFGWGSPPTLFHVHEFGLTAEFAGTLQLADFGTDAASTVGPSRRDVGEGNFLPFEKAMREFHIGPVIDLMVLNIEGGEFELLDALVRRAWFLRGDIRRLAVQWHTGLDPSEPDDPEAIQDLIALLHHHRMKLVCDLAPAWTYHEWQAPA